MRSNCASPFSRLNSFNVRKSGRPKLSKKVYPAQLRKRPIQSVRYRQLVKNGGARSSPLTISAFQNVRKGRAGKFVPRPPPPGKQVPTTNSRRASRGNGRTRRDRT